jgi:hypothetical protein
MDEDMSRSGDIQGDQKVSVHLMITIQKTRKKNIYIKVKVKSAVGTFTALKPYGLLYS